MKGQKAKYLSRGEENIEESEKERDRYNRDRDHPK